MYLSASFAAAAAAITNLAGMFIKRLFCRTCNT